MNEIQTPMPLGTACRWAAQQTIRLRDEGFVDEDVLNCCQKLFYRYAVTGNQSHTATVHRLLAGRVS